MKVIFSQNIIDELSTAFQEHSIKPGEIRLFFKQYSDTAIVADLVYSPLRGSNKDPEELAFVASNAFFVRNGEIFVGEGLRGDGDLPFEIQNDIVKAIENKIEEKKSNLDPGENVIAL